MSYLIKNFSFYLKIIFYGENIDFLIYENNNLTILEHGIECHFFVAELYLVL